MRINCEKFEVQVLNERHLFKTNNKRYLKKIKSMLELSVLWLRMSREDKRLF